MDILDILIAKKKSFSSESANLVEQASELAQQTSEMLEQLEESQDALDAALNAITGINITASDNINYKFDQIAVTNQSGIVNYIVSKNYKDLGNNEDGGMTQKAITDALEEIEVAANSTALGRENYGKIVIIDADGHITAGEVQEKEIIDTLIRSGAYEAINAVGLEIDYTNRSFSRTQEAVGLTQGTDFDKFTMYGGRKRCIVDRQGRIVSWYGDNNYIEDGSLGNVMIYQPKFYYNRTVSNYETTNRGRIIKKEVLTLSAIEQSGFKLHPLFKDENGNEIDYVLLPAYESCYYDVSENTIVRNDGANINSNEDRLLSVANAKPISGVNKNFTSAIAERMANNIGTGWHITNMAAESANQMLEIVEFGQMNGQTALEAGVVNVNNSTSSNGASLTGSTSSLGNTTGVAASTINEFNNNYNTYSDAGRRAISYRGFENPWGNLYRFIGGINLTGDGTHGSGIAYISDDYNYTPGVNGSNYKSVGFQLSPTSSWISAMGYGNSEYDWVYLPIDSTNATSLVPIGDFIWIENNLNGVYNIAIGGTQRQGDNCGLFYYACDQAPSSSTSSQSARIMHIPTKDSSIYLANIAFWEEKMGV